MFLLIRYRNVGNSVRGSSCICHAISDLEREVTLCPLTELSVTRRVLTGNTDPRAIVRLEGMGQLKNKPKSKTSSGIEEASFHLVACALTNCGCRLPILVRSKPPVSVGYMPRGEGDYAWV
jgi:hypothetical protein